MWWIRSCWGLGSTKCIHIKCWINDEWMCYSMNSTDNVIWSGVVLFNKLIKLVCPRSSHHFKCNQYANINLTTNFRNIMDNLDNTFVAPEDYTQLCDWWRSIAQVRDTPCLPVSTDRPYIVCFSMNKKLI